MSRQYFYFLFRSARLSINVVGTIGSDSGGRRYRGRARFGVASPLEMTIWYSAISSSASSALFLTLARPEKKLNFHTGVASSDTWPPIARRQHRARQLPESRFRKTNTSHHHLGSPSRLHLSSQGHARLPRTIHPLISAPHRSSEKASAAL